MKERDEAKAESIFLVQSTILTKATMITFSQSELPRFQPGAPGLMETIRYHTKVEFDFLLSPYG